MSTPRSGTGKSPAAKRQKVADAAADVKMEEMMPTAVSADASEVLPGAAAGDGNAQRTGNGRGIYVTLYGRAKKGEKKETVTIEGIALLSKQEIKRQLAVGLKLAAEDNPVLKYNQKDNRKDPWTVVAIGPQLPPGSYRCYLGPALEVLHRQASYHSAEMVRAWSCAHG